MRYLNNVLGNDVLGKAVLGTKKRLIVAVSGGSGLIYAKDLLESLKGTEIETHLVVTAGAKQVFPTELSGNLKDFEALADVLHKDSDLGASIASGSFRALGMVIVPCSAGTLAKVAQGFTDNLVSRAAHVTLKENRPLILLIREAPYSRPMLKNMLEAKDAGATILPASPGFYHQPQSIAELVAGITARTLDLLGIENSHSARWKDSDDD